MQFFDIKLFCTRSCFIIQYFGVFFLNYEKRSFLFSNQELIVNARIRRGILYLAISKIYIFFMNKILECTVGFSFSLYVVGKNLTLILVKSKIKILYVTEQATFYFLFFFLKKVKKISLVYKFYSTI